MKKTELEIINEVFAPVSGNEIILPSDEEIEIQAKAVKPFICDTYYDGALWMREKIREQFTWQNNGVMVLPSESDLEILHSVLKEFRITNPTEKEMVYMLATIVWLREQFRRGKTDRWGVGKK